MANKEFDDVQLDVTFTEAASHDDNIVSGENIAISLGKLAKWKTDFHKIVWSGSYNDLTNKPTIPTVNNGKLTIQKNGTSIGEFTANQSGNTTANIIVPTTPSDIGAAPESHTHIFPDIKPIQSKTFTDIIATANNIDNATFYFGKLIPDSWTDTVHLRYRIKVYCPSNVNYYQYADVNHYGRGATITYMLENLIYTGSYRSAYYHCIYRLTSTGYDSGYGHLVGESLYSSTNPTNSSYKRTFEIDILEVNGGTFEFFDNVTLYANAPGTGSTNYTGRSDYNFSFSGLYPDSNTVNQLRYDARLYAGSNGVKQYSLIYQNPDDKYDSLTTSGGTGTSKAWYTSAKIAYPPRIFHYAGGSAVSPNVLFGNYATNAANISDMRYSDNITTSTGYTINKSLYLECDWNEEGYFTISSSPYKQTFTSGKYYIFLGWVYTNVYQFSLQVDHPVYFYDGEKLIPFEEHRYALKEHNHEFSDITTSVADIRTALNLSHTIISGSQTTTSSADGGSNVYTFTDSEGTTSTFTVKNGSKGSKGDAGAAAGFGTPTATVDANVGTPSVTVTASGSDTAKVFTFAFKNLKGEPGSNATVSYSQDIANASTTIGTITSGSNTYDIKYTPYSHPTSAGNKHIPSGGSSGQFLKYSAAGTATWYTLTKSDIPALDYVSSTTTRNANTVLAGPSSGNAAAPTFRALVAADLPSHTHTKSQITDFPTSLKNPSSLTVQGNGTTSFTYDGSAAKTLNIKPGTGISVSSDTYGNITITNTSTNTDTKVTQNNSTANSALRVLLSKSANDTNETDVSYKSSKLTFNPSTGTLTSTTFSGALSGNASTATKLSTTRTIALSGGATGTATSFDGSANITIPVTSISPSHISDGYTTKGFYINTHPENNPTIIPFINNDIAFLLKRGGSAVVSYDDVVKSVDISNVFDGSPSYWAINPSGITTVTIELKLYKVFGWTSTIYVDSGANSWRAKDVKIEVMNTNYADDTWTQKGYVTNHPYSQYKILVSHTPTGAGGTGGGFNKIRLTFSNFATSTIFRIACIGVINYGSSGLRETFLPRDGGELYGKLILPRDQYTDSYTVGAIDCRNSNIIGINSLFFADLADTGSEGLQFYRTSTNVDSLWVSNGVIKFSPNRPLGTSYGITTYTVLHSDNYSSYALPLTGGTLSGNVTVSKEETAGPSFSVTNGTYTLSFLIGSSGTNRGIYDTTKSSWIVYKNANDEVILNGNAATATALTSSAGSATQPVYFSSGKPVSCTYTLGKSVPSDAVFTDTKNTTGSTNTSSKIFLIGATSQAANPQTYSHDTAYVGTDGCLYSNSTKVSVEGHTHSYLPLAGGTMTGPIKYNSGSRTSTPIAITDGDENGAMMTIGGTGGLTILGAGESANALGALIATDDGFSIPATESGKFGYTSEHLILSADSNIYFFTNCNAVADRKGIVLSTGLNLYPDTTNTGNIGTSSYKWAGMYATVFHGDLDGNASTATSAGKWTTERTLTIGSTGKSVDGSGNVSWTLAEIGAAASSHNHTKSQITDFPTSLKNPSSLTVQGNGTTSFTYDGSAAKTLNIKPGTGISISSDTSGNITVTNTSTNTDTKVTQNNSTADSSLRVLLSKSANDTNETDVSYKSNKITFNPSTGLLDIKGKVSISYSSYGCLELYRSGSNYMCAIKFYNDTAASPGTKQLLGSIAMGNDGLWYVKSDNSTKYKILDTENTSFTRTLTSGTKIGSIKIDGTSTDIYCETNVNTTYTLSGAYGSSSNTWVTTLTPSSGTATTSTVPTASTSVYGITKLSSATNSTSTALAATASAVKAAYDLANGKSTVSFTASLTSGTKVGSITINGTSTDIYCQTNTDTKVTQTETTTSAEYEVLFSGTNDDTTRTEGARKSNKFTFNPNTGELFSKTFTAQLASNSRHSSLYHSGLDFVIDNAASSAMGMKYYTTDGETQIGAIGMFSSANATEVNYAYIGKTYSSTWVKVTPDNTEFSGSIYVPYEILNKGRLCPYTTGGAVGYYCIAQFTITGASFSTPIEIEISDRSATAFTTFTLRFSHVSTTDPSVELFRYRGRSCTAYICKSDTSIWQLWVNTPTTYSQLTVHSIKCGNIHKFTVSYPELYMTTTDFEAAIADGGSLATNTIASIGSEYRVSAANQWITSRVINGMSINGTANRMNYGKCSTAADTAAKTVSCTGYVLQTGGEISVKFTTTNTAASPTLNVNSTGAKPIYYRGAAIPSSYLIANGTYTFRYNGSQYDLVGDVSSSHKILYSGASSVNSVTLNEDASNYDMFIVKSSFGIFVTDENVRFFSYGITPPPSGSSNQVTIGSIRITISGTSCSSEVSPFEINGTSSGATSRSLTADNYIFMVIGIKLK